MRDHARRAIEDCKRIATKTEEPGRITRRFLTAPVYEVHAYLRARMVALGMTAWLDAAGNLRGLWRPLNAADGPKLILGSHIDTVPNGGAYDGVLGVTVALEWVQIAQERSLPLAIEVIAFSEEEGVRFGVPFIGSRAVAGRFDLALLKLEDSDGVSLEAAIRAFGLEPAKLGDAAIDGNVAGFVEIHIEQGPVLEAEDLSVAAVTTIVGQSRLSLDFIGQANHAGTTPLHLRHDALAGAAEWIAKVEATARNTNGLIATVGRIAVEPNATNVVPGIAKVSLDVRHAHDGLRVDAVEDLMAKAQAIAGRRRLNVNITKQLEQPAVPMDERLTALLVEAMEATGMPGKRITSGAGHDAMVMAAKMPAAMLFLRSPSGISHHPAEDVREEDVEAAMQVGLKFLARLAAEQQQIR